MKNKFLLIVGFLVLVALVSAVVIAIVSPNTFKKPYSIVSASGTLYVGRVYSVPFSEFLKLKDAYVISDVLNDEGQPVDQELLPLKRNPIWSPDSIYINKSAILFKGLVGKCSLIDMRLNPDRKCPTPVQPSAQNNQGAVGDTIEK